MYGKYKILHDNGDQSSLSSEMSLWQKIELEYRQSVSNSFKNRKEVDRDLKTIRIFISSTFKDFYNERDVLVKTVFPKLRRWCEEEGLFLVECDLRWGVPTDATSVEAVSYCLDEIEKAREETSDNNFFIGLIGDRFGWVPSETPVIEELKEKYNWIENSSVTLMEIVHGIVRSGTQNCLLMLRSSESLENIPQNHLRFFQEDDESIKYNVDELKRFIQTNYSENEQTCKYQIRYDSTAIDPISGKERLLFKGFETFSEKIEEFLKIKISRFKEQFKISSVTEDKNDDMLHKSYFKSLDTSFKRESYLEDITKMLLKVKNSNLSTNPIFLITGEAGTGKSTLMGNLINYLGQHGLGKIFYHFCGTSNTSHSFSNIAERFINHINTSFGLKLGKIDETAEPQTLRELLTRNDIPEIMVIIDAIDEISDKDFDNFFPNSTSSNILLLASVLKEEDGNSVYYKIKNSERNIKEIEIEPMKNEQLSLIVANYLNNFGKRLDNSQMNALMSFRCSKNPLWLISACEELRIHGDYSTLKKLILSLPANILDLNQMIINRFIIQDSSNLIRCFLQVMIVSKAGVWESVIRDLLSLMMDFQEPVSHSTWSDIIRQLKGFLKIESIPLPLIKFRHRVTKQSIETELQLDNDLRLSLHGKMANFFEGTLENENNLFLGDYIYHLIKCDARNRMIKFMRSKKSWSLFQQSFVRSRFMMSMRCITPVNHGPQQSPSALMMCIYCSLKSGQLSIYTINKNSCYYCGNLVTSNDRIATCFHHKASKCALCDNFMAPGQGDYLKMCQICKVQGFQGNCGAIVKEGDILFRQQMGFSKATHNIENMI